MNIGQFKDGSFQGKCEYIWTSRYIYDGNWVKNSKESLTSIFTPTEANTTTSIKVETHGHGKSW